MKNPKSYIPGGLLEVCGDWNYELVEMIREIQKDAYNQAIDDATESAKCIIFTHKGKKHAAAKKQSILKLKIK